MSLTCGIPHTCGVAEKRVAWARSDIDNVFQAKLTWPPEQAERVSKKILPARLAAPPIICKRGQQLHLPPPPLFAFMYYIILYLHQTLLLLRPLPRTAAARRRCFLLSVALMHA